ncbi:MAG: cytochrome c oxidase assembly protein [Alphaproteobacteria bacterium]|jgi:cytochrome c oxidase assembly protein subunit 11|nr:cytochrome c oxidase assembly protein [Alphaproteobacteria bacterium]
MVGSRNLGVILAGLVATMLVLAYASVPLYRLFCQKTGFGGTTQVAKAPSTSIRDREITVRFNADVHRDLPWHFRPLQTEIKVKIGENALAFYESQNFSDKPISGMATYNVTPDKAALYFNKVACFCFEEQVLSPQQRVDMPVQFFIDPDYADDPDLKDVHTITLSYTFFKFNK